MILLLNVQTQTLIQEEQFVFWILNQTKQLQVSWGSLKHIFILNAQLAVNSRGWNQVSMVSIFINLGIYFKGALQLDLIITHLDKLTVDQQQQLDILAILEMSKQVGMAKQHMMLRIPWLHFLDHIQFLVGLVFFMKMLMILVWADMNLARRLEMPEEE